MDRYNGELEDRNYGDLLSETEYWLIFLAPNQSNIGTCVVALKRHCGTLDSLLDEEWLDFAKIVRQLEYSIKCSFNPIMFNWGSLMNAEYLIENPDPHVHWHFIPRYNQDIQFEGLTFQDVYFGKMEPQPIKIREVSNVVREKIIEKIRESLSK